MGGGPAFLWALGAPNAQSVCTVMPGLANRTPRVQFSNEFAETTTSRPPLTRMPVSESKIRLPTTYCWLSWSSRYTALTSPQPRLKPTVLRIRMNVLFTIALPRAIHDLQEGDGGAEGACISGYRTTPLTPARYYSPPRIPCASIACFVGKIVQRVA